MSIKNCDSETPVLHSLVHYHAILLKKLNELNLATVLSCGTKYPRVSYGIIDYNEQVASLFLAEILEDRDTFALTRG